MAGDAVKTVLLARAFDSRAASVIRDIWLPRPVWRFQFGGGLIAAGSFCYALWDASWQHRLATLAIALITFWFAAGLIGFVFLSVGWNPPRRQ